MTDEKKSKLEKAAEAVSAGGKAVSGIMDLAKLVKGGSASVSPYPWLGGSASDYATEVGPSGTALTRHLPSNSTIQSVMPSGAAGAGDMLAVANLAVGIVNLGVGIYNAYQLRQVRQGIENIQDDIASFRSYTSVHFERIEGTLALQCRAMDVLSRKQDALAEALVQLHREMVEGFRGVIGELKAKEARDYQERVYKLHQSYSLFASILPDPAEARPLLGASIDLDTWVLPRLKEIPVGNPRRMPLVFARAMASRACADAGAILGGGYREEGLRRVEEIENCIREEAFVLVDGKTIYNVGVQYAETIAQYGLLHRALRQGRMAPEKGLPEIGWDDGLQEMRDLLSLASTKKEGIPTLALKSIADYQWLAELLGKDPELLDIHQIKSINVGTILENLGAPKPGLAKVAAGEVAKFRELALQAKNAEPIAALEEEFRWNARRPKLAPMPWNLGIAGRTRSLNRIRRKSHSSGSHSRPESVCAHKSAEPLMNFCPDCGYEMVWPRHGNPECEVCDSPSHDAFNYCWACGQEFYQDKNEPRDKVRGYVLVHDCDRMSCTGKVADFMFYCPWCGKKQVYYFGGQSECGSCKSAISGKWAFCAFCGEELE